MTTDRNPSDAISDAITALLVEFSPCEYPGIIADHADNLTHDVWAVCQALTNQRELAIAEAGFEAEVERVMAKHDTSRIVAEVLAEHNLGLDKLRSERTLLLRIPMLLNPAEPEPLPQEIGAALLDNLGDDWWTRDDGDTRFCLVPPETTPTSAEIL